MLALVTYDMIRKLNEERRESSIRRFWWRYGTGPEESRLPLPTPEAMVIEMVFGAQCEAEEPIGA
jgi:hypothetical protein